MWPIVEVLHDCGMDSCWEWWNCVFFLDQMLPWHTCKLDGIEGRLDLGDCDQRGDDEVKACQDIIGVDPCHFGIDQWSYMDLNHIL